MLLTNLVNGVKNIIFVPGFLVNSMPKAGTHLLVKTVESFSGIRRTKGDIINRLAEYDNSGRNNQVELVLIGVDWPKPVSVPTLRKSLKAIRKGHFKLAHTCYSEKLVSLLNEFRMKTLLILRDPRDVAVSHANFVAKKRNHFLYDYYQGLSEYEQLMTSIRGLEQSISSKPMLLNIYERYKSLLPWLNTTLNYTTSFEKLVGPNGGGSRKSQISEIRNIANHLGIIYNSDSLDKISDRIFGGTTTFNKGNIGNWRFCFNKDHIRVFKEIAGQLLIDLEYESDFNW